MLQKTKRFNLPAASSVLLFIAVLMYLAAVVYQGYHNHQAAADSESDLKSQQIAADSRTAIANAATDAAIAAAADPVVSACAVLIVRGDQRAADCQKFLLDRSATADLN